MNDHFIKYIEIKDFKCFDDFKTEGLAQVNLIGGKNNVGKTAFMEACYVNSHAKNIKNFIYALYDIRFMRVFLNLYFTPYSKNTKNYVEASNNLCITTNTHKSSFNIYDTSNIKKYHFELYKGVVQINANDFSFDMEDISNINFIDNIGLANHQIAKAYSFIQKKDKEIYLDTILKKIDSSIEAFKIINERPQCKIKDLYLDLTELGDGARHLISIVATLYSSENGQLFIDEIDNGIHYSMLDKVWEIILTLSKELNVQVFATTHSKECIESYGRVAKKLEDNDINYMKLVRKKSGEIVAANYDYDLFLSTLEQNHEVRGW